MSKRPRMDFASGSKERKKGAREKLAQFIKDRLKMDAEARGPPLSATISIFGLDLAATEEEVRAAVSKTLNNPKAENIRVATIRPNAKGDRSVLVRLTRQDADKITKQTHIKIGWVSCRLKEWHVVPQCYRCQEIGHVAARCRAAGSKERTC